MTDSTWELLTNPLDPRHGSVNAYTNHNCRCDRCKAANARQQKAARERRRQTPYEEIPAQVHGTENGYTNWGCRCGPCTDAHNENARNKRKASQ